MQKMSKVDLRNFLGYEDVGAKQQCFQEMKWLRCICGEICMGKMKHKEMVHSRREGFYEISRGLTEFEVVWKHYNIEI